MEERRRLIGTFFILLWPCSLVMIGSVAPIQAASSRAIEYRALDNTGNNKRTTTNGKPNGKQLRNTPVYSEFTSTNSYSMSRGSSAPNPRAVSNAIAASAAGFINNRGGTDAMPAFAQFVNHDLVATPQGTESASISVPSCDPVFDSGCTGTQSLPFLRSTRDTNGQITNSVTPFLDLSQVYGETAAVGQALRATSGGLLKMVTDPTYGDFLPVEGVGVTLPSGRAMANPYSGPRVLFASGDTRANENPLLQVFHTIFAREHNRLAKELASQNSDWNDETLYQEARRRNIAQYQAIIYYEYLPIALGAFVLPWYMGYNESVDPQVDVAFSTAAYRYYHTEMNTVINRLRADYLPTPGGPVLLRDSFFDTRSIMEEGIEPFLIGLQYSLHQEDDTLFRDDLRNLYWSRNGGSGTDLFASNIQRGRDHGTCTLNQCRQYLGLAPYTDFSQLTSSATLANTLKTLYNNDIDSVDLYVGGLCEARLRNGNVGSTFELLIIDQFTRARDGDRFFFATSDTGLRFNAAELGAISGTRLSTIIGRNSNFQPKNSLFLKPLTSGDPLFTAAELSALSQEVHVLLPNKAFYIGWNNSADGNTISFRVAGKTRGYVALGIGQENATFPMVNMDTIFGYLSYDARGIVRDCYSKGRVVPPMDLYSDLTLSGAGQTDSGVTWMVFTRALVTPDNVTDNPIVNKMLPIYWAMGPTNSFLYHGSQRGTVTANLLDPKSNLLSPAAAATSGTFVIHPSYSIQWELRSATEIAFTAIVTCQGGCWVGFGVGVGPVMAGADMAIAMFDDKGVVTLKDGFAGGYSSLGFDSSQQGGTDNLKLISGSQTASTTTVRFSRPLTAIDANYDNPIQIGALGTQIIVGWGTSNQFGYHTPANHASSIMYFTDNTDNSASAALGVCALWETETKAMADMTIHGSLLAVAWWVLASIGILAQEYGKHSGMLGRIIHKLCMAACICCTLAGFIYMVLARTLRFDGPHLAVGFTVVVLAIVQGSLGIAIGFFPLMKPLRYLHRGIGYIAWIGSQVNIGLGLGLVRAPSFYFIFYLIGTGIVVIALLGSKFGRGRDDDGGAKKGTVISVAPKRITDVVQK